MFEMEMRHREELDTLKQEKGSLQVLVGRQSGVIGELEAQLNRASGNGTALQRQQQEMMDTVHNLLNLCNKDGGKPTGIKGSHAKKFGIFVINMLLQNGHRIRSIGSFIVLKPKSQVAKHGH